MNLKNQRILVTGGEGFLGNYVVEELKKRDPKEMILPNHSRYDLRNRDVCRKVVKGVDIVIHLAAQIGGIGFIDEIPGEIFYNNAVMGLELMEASRLEGVKKVVTIGTVCEYPEIIPIPFKERDLWNGFPEETTAPYGWAKKLLIVQGMAYRRQYGFNSIHLLPVNLYGPKDNFNRRSTHVIPALIRRVFELKDKGGHQFSVWGSGNATREFLFVEDAARGIVMAAEKYDSDKPVNLGTGIETSIKDLVKMIMKYAKYDAKIVWDKTKPDGQLRRRLDVSCAKKFGFVAKVGLAEGLQKTIEWYDKNR